MQLFVFLWIGILIEALIGQITVITLSYWLCLNLDQNVIGQVPRGAADPAHPLVGPEL